MTIFLAFFGDWNLDDLRQVQYWYGTFIFLCVAIVGALILNNVFIAVVSKAYGKITLKRSEV
mgnify:CR=1 FL=1